MNTSSPISSNTHDELDQVNGDGEQMVIKTQPDLPKYAMQPMAIGEKLNLKFEVSCGRPVIYEWLKQGIREDVMNNPATSSVRAAITPVSNGRELVGEVVEGGEGITSWQYLCRAFCPSTGETLYSNIVKLKVAKATTNECSFPKFKIALVICEEKYQKTQQFPSLKGCVPRATRSVRAISKGSSMRRQKYEIAVE